MIAYPRMVGFSLRFAVVGAFLGYLAGIGEAVYLATTPSPPVFLELDVSYAIWFVAPLAGACVLGLLALATGFAASTVGFCHPGTSIWMACGGMGLVAVYMGAALGWLRGGGEGLFRALTRGEAGVWFLVGFLGSFVLMRFGGKRTERFLDAEARSPVARLIGLHGLAVAVSASGLAYYRWSHSSLSIPKTRTTQDPTHKSPNIVLITLDTVRADHLSSYGYARPTTPHLDRWARKGVLFENAIAPTSWTLASHATIFTGILPHQHGANQAAPLYPGPLPLARILQSKGYETAGFSANLSYGLAGWGMSKGFDTYEDDSVSLRHNLRRTKLGWHLVQPAYERLVHCDDFDRRNGRELNRDVIRWFRRRSGRPYFLFVNYYDPHLSYFAPPPYDNRFGSVDKASMRETCLIETGRLPRPLSSREQEALIAGYDNCLAYLDEEVGRLLHTLAEAPDGANTIFIITSDHGEGFGEHELYGHGWDLHREVLHVPLIILGPGIPSNQRTAHIVRLREIFPTVLEMALGPREPFSRVNLSRFWTTGFKPEPFDEVVISELVSASPDFQPAFASLMTSEWHYIHDSRGQSKLYRWPVDPNEQANLATDAQHQETLRNLHALLLDRLSSSHRPWRGPEYLFGLDGPGFSFLREAAFGMRNTAGQPEMTRRIGTAQAFFTPDSGSPRRLHPPDEELIRSLPYH